jgi:uncharacterized protein (TIGR00255 family)
MNSMTGFGRGQAVCAGRDLTVEMYSVNKRSLELFTNLPREWQALERELADRIRSRVQRGKIQVTVTHGQPSDNAGLFWDEAALTATVQRIEHAAFRLGVKWTPDADALVRLVSLHRADGAVVSAATAREPLLAAADAALEQLCAMRSDEGQTLLRDLNARCDALRAHTAAIVVASGDTVSRYRNSLLSRLQQSGLPFDLDDERVLREIAIFADRCDISEEITRLQSHFDQLAGALCDGAASGEPVGRKLEFILQEVHRELNTIGSKAANTAVSQSVIESKNEVERVREQLQNVE